MLLPYTARYVGGALFVFAIVHALIGKIAWAAAKS